MSQNHTTNTNSLNTDYKFIANYSINMSYGQNFKQPNLNSKKSITLNFNTPIFTLQVNGI
jgi:outer membrane cobalamin receptor